MGWRALPTTTTPTATPWSVANQVLGGGMSSRLFQEIREERGLAYSVYSSPSSYSDAGCLRALRRHRASPAGASCST